MMHSGRCLCGEVVFEVTGPLAPPNACHCTICRKSSGHIFASTEVAKTSLRMIRDDGLRWYASSARVRRGFCGTCGASLFFDPPHRDWIAIAMGALDGPTGVKMTHHIFCNDKGDYYDISDGLPQNGQ